MLHALRRTVFREVPRSPETAPEITEKYFEGLSSPIPWILFSSRTLTERDIPYWDYQDLSRGYVNDDLMH
jgi:hypothetical protein